jgi:hypothetical protein
VSESTIERPSEVPGLGPTAVETVIAEIGPDMRPFPTAGHLLSWAGPVPRLDESAGKRRSTRMKKAPPGSSLYWCNAPGQQRAKRTAIFKPNFCVSRRGMAPRRPQSQLLPRS